MFRILPCLLVVSLSTMSLTAQEKSVKPGINKSFENPDVKQFVGRFEREGRDVFDHRKEILDALKLKPGMNVADVGAGTGLFTRLFSPIVGQEGKIYAVDISDEFLEHINKTAREQNLTNITTVVCKADSAELPPESVDLVFICDTYHHFEFPYKTMRSIHRALKPGGQVVLIDFHRIEGVSDDWTLGHVRAGQEVFTKEILDTGFKQVEEIPDLLDESYFVRFEMAPSGQVAAVRTESAVSSGWTGWLGPNRDGWVDDFEPPAAWPEKLDKAWQVEVGTGYGTPLVVGDRVYQHARQGEDEVLWCLDLDTGEIIWKRNWTVPFKIGGGGDFHGKGPKSSPSIADGRIFTMSISGDLSAWDAEQGDLLWRSDYGSRFKSNHPYWGASTSPIVAGDRVLVHLGTDDEGLLVALDAKTGNEAWSLGQDGPSYSSPLVVEIAGVRQLVEWNHRALVGVELATGEKLWEFPFEHVGTNQNMPTPAFHDGQVLVGGENRGIFAVKPIREGESWTATAAWHQKRVALDMSSAVINDGLLYGMSHYNSGQFFCLDPKTGDILWEGTPRLGSNVMFLSIPGHVVALVDKGELKIIAAKGKDSQVVASYAVSDTPTWAPPVLLQDSVLVKDLNTLTRWKLR